MRSKSELLKIVKDEFEKTEPYRHGITSTYHGITLYVFGLCGFIGDLYNAKILTEAESLAVAKILDDNRLKGKTSDDYWWPPCTSYNPLNTPDREKTKTPRIEFLNRLIEIHKDA